MLPYTVWKGGDDALVTEFYQLAKSNVDFFLREASKDGLIEFVTGIALFCIVDCLNLPNSFVFQHTNFDTSNSE